MTANWPAVNGLFEALSLTYDLSGRINAWSVRVEDRRSETGAWKVDSRRTYSASEMERMMKLQDVLLKVVIDAAYVRGSENRGCQRFPCYARARLER
jgi:hypothetical protein